MKKILLIEPDYKSRYLPLGLAKISARHKQEGNIVRYHKGSLLFFDRQRFVPDVIYITSLYTWNMKEVRDSINECLTFYKDAKIYVGGIAASLMKKKLEEEYGSKIEVAFGPVDHFEQVSPDFDLFGTDYLVAFTTRGCCNKCPYCMVPILEPKFEVIDNWFELLKPHLESGKYKKVYFWDNNFLNAPYNHIADVINKISRYKVEIEFNQGLDAKFFTRKIAKLFSKVRTKIKPLIFAFDSMRSDGYLQKAVKVAQEFRFPMLEIYMMYNFFDTPEEMYYKFSEISKLGSQVPIFPMRYQDLESENKGDYIGRNWTSDMLRGFTRFRARYFGKAMRFRSPANFIEICGKDAEEFKKRLNDLGKEKRE